MVALALAALAVWLMWSGWSWRPQPQDVKPIGLAVPGKPSLAPVRVRTLMRIPWGDAAGRIAFRESGVAVGDSFGRAFGYYLLADGGAWILDAPRRLLGPRAQRFDKSGRLKVRVALGPGSGLPYATPEGDLYYVRVDSAAGAERVIRRDGRGRTTATYRVPPGDHLTAVQVSPDGAVFGRVEVWERDPSEAVYAYFLRPRLIYLGSRSGPTKSNATPLNGYAFVPSGELMEYERRVQGGAQPLEVRTASYYSSRSSQTRRYKLGTQLAWVGSDSSGDIFTELLNVRVDPIVEPTVDGRVQGLVRDVAVFARDGRFLGAVRLPWHPAVASCVDPIKVDRSGRIFIVGADSGGFLIQVAELGVAR